MLDRIKRFIETQNMTASGFANVIGVQRSSVSHILSGRNKPSLDFVLKLKEHYPDLNLDWLLFGTGPILMSKNYEKENRHVQNEIEFDKSVMKKNPESSKKPYTVGDQKVEKNQTPIEVLPNSNDDKMTEYEVVNSKKDLKKVILLYQDGSFEEFNPTK